MSLIQQDANLPPRIVPKVFADVPSAQELAAARSGRTGLVVGLVLLIGLLIPTAAAVVYFEGQTRELGAQIDESEKVIRERDDKIKAMGEEADKLKADVATVTEEKRLVVEEYGLIDSRYKKTKELRAEIEKLLATPEKAGAAKLAAKVPAYARSKWPDAKVASEENLGGEVAALEGLLKAVQDWRPAGGSVMGN